MRRFFLALATATGGGSGVSLPGSITVDDTENNPTTASASITFDADGTYTTAGDISGSGNWYSPTTGSIGSLYEIRFAPSSGSVSSGTVNTWLSMASPVAWTRTRGTPGISDVSGTLEIRLASSGVVQATTTLTLTAEQI